MVKKEILNWGLVGCGDIAKRRVAPALRSLENGRLTATARKNVSLLKAFADEFGIEKTYCRWEDLVNDPDLDAVYIATPVFLHAEMTVAAAKAGKHVLCEKPMAMTVKECGAMILACKENGVKLGVAYYRHHYPLVRKIHSLIRDGAIGQVMIAQMNAFSDFDRSPGEPRYWLLEKDKSGGGPMMDFGCHRIEVLLDLLGPVQSVHAHLDNLRFKRQVEDTAIVFLKFESGGVAALSVTHTAFENEDTLDIFGSHGSIHVPSLNEGSLILKKKTGESTFHLPPHKNLHFPLIEDFTRAVLEDREPMVAGETGLAVNRILGSMETNSF